MPDLEFYFDDSFDGPIYALAGYAASRPVWEDCFRPAWKAAIQAAPHPIREFKTSDCRLGVGEFSARCGWTGVERLELTKSLVSVLADACPYKEMVGFGAVALLPGHAVGEWRRIAEEFGFQLCLRHLLGELLDISAKLLDATGDTDGRVRIVYDEKDGYSAMIQEQLLSARADLASRREQVLEPESRRSCDDVALQAADLLAYETFKEVKNQLECRPPSKALVRLVEARHHRVHCIDFACMHDIQVRMQSGSNVDEATIPPLFLHGRAMRSQGLWAPPGPPWMRPYWVSTYAAKV